ncbi:hypothetical protein GCM10011519_13980 [Marmoricola endophyticus]|uniref:Glycosyltransferase 61 catalytic domain-containing protein n=1 Tax=Marmoricola endophyticus TaxID=2040280 RepID=A0A917BFM8_9ACTN|nr:glycosyltransferase 61 family protein [Marmoricola endophyticus]GGF41396.1 hypothetical protein GCM10011519_13980 [Marmoricola endophyticus]
MTASGPTAWAVPPFPHEPVDEPTLSLVEDAYLTRMQRGPLRTVRRPDRWISGAVHSADGRLVRDSQKIGGLGGNRLVAADPNRVPIAADARRLPGTWLYGGHWIDHFGHFVTETLPTLWPRDLRVDGLVFHAFGPAHAGVLDWERTALDLTSYAGLPVEVVKTEPVRVERLHVPTRGVVVNGWAHPGAVEVWSQMARTAGGRGALRTDGPRVFLSRTGFNTRLRERGEPTRSDAGRDHALDEVFARTNFEVVEPERLPVADQVRLVAGASVLAGGAGTALHLSAFAPAGVRVLEIGDTRSPGWQVPHQQVLDHAREHPSALVPAEVPPESYPAVLERLGLA